MIQMNLLEITGIVLIALNELSILLSPFTFRLLPASKKEKNRTFPDMKRVAVVICAHNEESTIGALLHSLQEQMRPADAIYVVADNCSDKTAVIAKDMGAVVLEKEPTVAGGKADALKFFLEHLSSLNYDGFVFFDADTMPNAVFLEKIILGLEHAEMAVGRHCFDNFSKTCSEAANSMLGNVMWHHYLEPRYKNGIYSLFMGMGYGLRRSYLERLQWTPHTRTEDLALSLDAALTGAEFVLCPEAQFRDKQPETWSVSWHRMRRWMTGDLQCLHFYFFPLLKQILRGDLIKLDFLLFLLSVPFYILKAFGLLCLIAAVCFGNWEFLALVLAFDLFVDAAAIFSSQKPYGFCFRDIPALYFFNLQLPWIAFTAFVFPTKHWVPGRQAPCSYMDKENSCVHKWYSRKQ